jgi:hypothetical protein
MDPVLSLTDLLEWTAEERRLAPALLSRLGRYLARRRLRRLLDSRFAERMAALAERRDW